VTIAIELSLIVLLVMAIGYGFALNRKITALRRDQKDLEKLAMSFSKATQRAEQGVAQLRAATQGSVTELQGIMTKAEGMRRDLEFLIDRGTGTADKLERSVRTAERGGADRGEKMEPRNSKIATLAALAEERIDRRAANERVANEPVLGVATRRDVNQSEKADAERQLLKALRAVR
jgi:hypothetical protein